MAGAIVMAPVLTEDMLETIRLAPFPVVLLNAGKKVKHAPVVNIENYQGAYAMTEHLLKFDYRSIGLIRGAEGNFDADERARGQFVFASLVIGLTEIAVSLDVVCLRNEVSGTEQ